MDLKRDVSKSRYISLRTGLGYNKQKDCPYFAERDTIFPLDFEFTKKDLELVSTLQLRKLSHFFNNSVILKVYLSLSTKINQIRYNLDTLLYTFGDKNPNETVSVENKFALMSKLKEITIR